MSLSNDDNRYIGNQLRTLYETASKYPGWYKYQAKDFIRVGEYALALDGIAYAYLNNNETMPDNIFDIFDRLADMMNLAADAEYEGVAKLRALQATRESGRDLAP